jgi:hypothetical protein
MRKFHVEQSGKLELGRTHAKKAKDAKRNREVVFYPFALFAPYA